jgi:integrase
MSFAKFVGDPNAADDQFGEGTFLDWARHNKRSWKHDQFRVRPLLRAFAGKTLGEITRAAIETFKSIRLHSVTRRKTKRSPASVKHEMNVLSRIFSLAVTWGLADSNPCSRVSRIQLQNQRYRYLLPDEEPRLLAQCTGKRKHLAPMIAFAIGTGARKSEQLTLKGATVRFLPQPDHFRQNQK